MGSTPPKETSGANVYSKSTVTIIATATDDRGVSRVEFYVNGVLIGTDTTRDATGAYAYAWRVPPRRNRTYRLQTKAYDTASQLGASGVVTVTSR